MKMANWWPLVSRRRSYLIIHWRNYTWKVMFLVPMVWSIVFLCLELNKYSSDFCSILIYSVVFSVSFALLLRVIRNRPNIRNKWAFFPLLTIIGLLISVDNDVITRSDGQIGNILKRIYVKEATVDVSQEFNKHTKPKLVAVLDMSGSTQDNKIDPKNLFYKETDYWYEKLYGALTTAGIKSEDRDKFLTKIGPKNKKNELTEYDVYKFKLLDLVSKVQKKYEISIVCFGKYPIPSQTYDNENQNSLEKIFYFINDYEKDRENKQLTDFVKLFEKLVEEYDYTGDEKNINESPKYTYIFFSDYIHESINATSKTDLEDIITKFSKSPNFNNFYYFEGKNYEELEPDKKGINIYSILKRIFREESGKFSSLTENYTELFNISSNLIIPLYYEYAFGEQKSKTKITFDSIKHPFTCDISLDNNIEHRKDHHHQLYFSVNNEHERRLFPKKDARLDSTGTLVLQFEGRVIEQFPCHSLVFYFDESKGYCKFDIVFFKDFPPYVRYITTFLMLGIMVVISYLALSCFWRIIKNPCSSWARRYSRNYLVIALSIIIITVLITILFISLISNTL